MFVVLILCVSMGLCMVDNRSSMDMTSSNFRMDVSIVSMWMGVTAPRIGIGHHKYDQQMHHGA